MIQTKTPPKEDKIIDWHYCYQGNWNKEVAPEAIAHPAKFARLLVKRIYELCLDEGWLEPGDTVLDMFGGTALGAKDALFNGVNWLGIELERHFVDIGNGVACTGISKEDYVRFYGRWDKVNRKDGRYWCPQCLAQLKKDPEEKEMPPTNEFKKRRKRMVKLTKKIRKRLDRVDVNSLSPEDKELHKKKKALLRLSSNRAMPLPGTRAATFSAKINAPTQVGLFDDANEATYSRNSGLIPFTVPHRYVGNLERFRKKARYGAQALLVQGDSRELLKIVGGLVDGSVSSPAYGQANSGGKAVFDQLEEKYNRKFTNKSGRKSGYQGESQGDSDGQMAEMAEGNLSATLSSPMFSGNSGGTGEASQQGIDKALFKRHSGSMNKGLMSEDGANLGNMGHGDFDASIASPTFSNSIKGQTDKSYDQRKKDALITGDSQFGGGVYPRVYGSTEGQMAALDEGNLDASLASPAFENSIGSDEAEKRGGILLSDPKRKNDKNLTGSYGRSEGQLGIEKGDTFWSASRTILEQTYLVLKSQAVSIWVLKDYIRDGQIVEFSDQWRRLCEAVGFEHELTIRAWLTETEAVQLQYDGQLYKKTTSKKSFFRRVHEKNGLPAIDWEIVLVMRKP